MKFLQANKMAPDETPRFAASHLRLFCLSMSNKMDVGKPHNYIVICTKDSGYILSNRELKPVL